jgi:hypothetical protein
MCACPTGASRASTVASPTSSRCVEGGGGVAGIPDQDGVDEQLEAEGVAVVESEWEILRARVLDEEPYPDIAGRLRCSEAVVRKRVSRAKAHVRTALGGNGV